MYRIGLMSILFIRSTCIVISVVPHRPRRPLYDVSTTDLVMLFSLGDISLQGRNLRGFLLIRRSANETTWKKVENFRAPSATSGCTGAAYRLIDHTSCLLPDLKMSRRAPTDQDIPQLMHLPPVQFASLRDKSACRRQT